MRLSDKRIQEFKRLFKEEYGVDYSDEEASEAAHNFIGFAELIYSCAKQDYYRKLKLKESPNGFHLPDGENYNCYICYNVVSGESSWYNKRGITCLVCKEALQKRVIPVSVMKDRDSWLAMWEVKKELGLHHSTVQKMIRTGELKARIIKNGEYDYFWVFLKRENEVLI